MTRVAIFTSSFDPHLGGVEELVRQLAHQLDSSGESPLVVTMRWPKDLASAEVVAGIPVRRHIFRMPERRPRPLLAYAVDSWRVQRRIERQLVHHGTEVVHVQCVGGNGLYAWRAARSLGLPLVVTLQGELTMDAAGIYQRSTALGGMLRLLLTHATAVTACSRQTLSEAELITGIELGSRGHVVHNGVSCVEFDVVRVRKDRSPYMLSIGRHVRQKGFDVLLDAVAVAWRRCPSLPRLVLAGDGDERNNLVQQAKRLGISDRVDFVGRTARTETAQLFHGCEFFVLPSRHEPQGIVNLEAMAAGKAVVATNAGGVAEIVADGVTGVLVSPGSALDLADGLERIWAADRASMGRAGRKTAEHYDWAAVAQRYAEIYSKATDTQGGVLPRLACTEMWTRTPAIRRVSANVLRDREAWS